MIALAFCLAVFGARRASWMIVPSFNAVPQGEHTTEVSLPACEAAASAGGCAQFSFNLHSGHCYRSNSTSFSGIASDHVTSGCDATRVWEGSRAEWLAPRRRQWIFETPVMRGGEHVEPEWRIVDMDGIARGGVYWERAAATPPSPA